MIKPATTTYSHQLAELGSISPDKQKESPVREALSALYHSIATAQKTHNTLETQLSPVLASYPVNTMHDICAQDTSSPDTPSSGCSLSDEIFGLVRMVNSLVDRQEAMSRHIQL